MRRVAVFKVDGTPLYDRVHESEAAPTTKSSLSTTSACGLTPASTATISASALWPLIQVFIKFSRDVQGGHIRRLVFRSPASYAPSTHRFQPSAHAATPRCAIVYVGQSDRYVVTVTGAAAPQQQFVAALLDFLHKEHGAFLQLRDHQKGSSAHTAISNDKQVSNLSVATSAHDNKDDGSILKQDHATPSGTIAPPSGTRNDSASNSSASRMSPAHRDAISSSPHSAAVSHLPSTDAFINHTKISDFIKNLRPAE